MSACSIPFLSHGIRIKGFTAPSLVCWLLCGQKKLQDGLSIWKDDEWSLSLALVTDCCQEAVAPRALASWREGLLDAAPGIEGVTGLAGVAELPVLSELGCFSLLTSQPGRKAVPCLPCQVSHGIQTCSGPWPLTPSARLLCSSWWPGRVFIYNILMAILTPLIVNDRAISLSIAVWTIMFGLLKWQNIH